MTRLILFIAIVDHLREVIAKRKNEGITGSDICAGTTCRFVPAAITRVAEVDRDTTGEQVVLKIVFRSCAIS